MTTGQSSRIPTEDQEQVALIEWMTFNGFRFFHVNNEMWTTSQRQKRRSAAMGVMSGVPDLFIFIPVKHIYNLPNGIGHGSSYRPISIELKRRKGGKLTPTQVNWGEVLNDSDIPWRCCKGWNEAVDFIKEIIAQIEARSTPEVQYIVRLKTNDKGDNNA